MRFYGIFTIIVSFAEILSMEYQVKLIAQMLRGEVEGDPETLISGVSKIEEGRPGTLSFLANPKYTKYIIPLNLPLSWFQSLLFRKCPSSQF